MKNGEKIKEKKAPRETQRLCHTQTRAQTQAQSQAQIHSRAQTQAFGRPKPSRKHNIQFLKNSGQIFVEFQKKI